MVPASVAVSVAGLIAPIAAEAEAFAAVLVGPAHGVAVDLVAGREIAVEHVEPERLAHGEGGLLCFVNGWDLPCVALRDHAVPRGVPAAAAEAFERAAMKLPIKTKVVARLGDTSHLGGE